MLMKKRLICAVAVVLMIGSLISCTSQEKKKKYTTLSMDYFDTVITITGYENSQEEFDTRAGEILSQLKEYHQLYNIYHSFDGLENLYTVNEATDVHTFELDKRIIDMLLYAKEMYTLTDGMMNVAMGSVLSLWHTSRTNGNENPEQASLPPIDMLKKASLHTDISKLVIDEESCTVTLTDPLMKLDVGAIAKGYATECIARDLEEKGVSGYILNVGGNVRTIGLRADGTEWTVGIENPNGGEYLAHLKLNGQSLVTSGSYQRFYYVDGKPYHHIIDPDTLMPAEGYSSVSVVCRDSGMADALSTALFCMSQEDGMALVDMIDGVEAMWLTENGEKTTSAGWKQYEK